MDIETKEAFSNLNGKLDKFVGEMKEFKDDMIAFKDDMVGFKGEMKEFARDMYEFRDFVKEKVVIHSELDKYATKPELAKVHKKLMIKIEKVSGDVGSMELFHGHRLTELERINDLLVADESEPAPDI